MKLEKNMEESEVYFSPRKNNIFLVRIFYLSSRNRTAFDDYMTKLRKLDSDGKLEGLQESLLRDMPLIGLNNKKLQECLLGESNLDLNKTVESCRVVEVICLQAHVIQHNSTVNPDYKVDKVHRQFSNNQKSQKENPDLIKKGKFCSFSHKRNSCPAYGKLCNNCKKENIFAKCCNTKKVNNVHKYQNHPESDEISKSFENEASFTGTIK